jgi:hypothetical protein
MRIALLTLEALAAARAVRRFVAEATGGDAVELVLVGLSDPFGGGRGGVLRQSMDHLRRSGPRFIPYLAANFVVPRLRDSLWRLLPWPAGAAHMPLDVACRRRGIACLAVRDVRGAVWREAMSRQRVDLIVSFHFDQILDADGIAAAPLGGVNVHAGLLPHHRGPVPTLHALLEQPPRFGVTVHRLAPRIDAGPILAQLAMDLPPGTTALGAARALHEQAVGMLQTVLRDIAQGRSVEHAMAPLPYCGFPAAADLRALARAGRSAVGWADLAAAAGLAA